MRIGARTERAGHRRARDAAANHGHVHHVAIIARRRLRRGRRVFSAAQ